MADLINFSIWSTSAGIGNWKPTNANAVAAQAKFAGNVAIAQALTAKERKLIYLRSLMDLLNTLLNVNYTAASSHATMVSDAMFFTRGLSLLDMDPTITAAVWNNARNQNGTFSSGVPTILANMADLNELPDELLDRIIVFIRSLTFS